VEKVCSDDILSPMCDVSNDDCAPHPFKIPMKIVECAMDNCYSLRPDLSDAASIHFIFYIKVLLL
jgi:hypothetical protein